MGLTVHYDFSLPLTVGPEEVQAILAQWREFAKGLGAGKVTSIEEAAPDDLFASQMIFRRDAATQVEWHYTIPVESGWQFTLRSKHKCEPLHIGLCRYPAWIEADGKRVATRLGGAWRYRFFCKTHHASLAGWETFLAAHRAVVDCLARGREYGIQVKIRDEGGYWPRRDTRTLQRRLMELNGHLAVFVAAVKEARHPRGGEDPGSRFE